MGEIKKTMVKRVQKIKMYDIMCCTYIYISKKETTKRYKEFVLWKRKFTNNPNLK